MIRWCFFGTVADLGAGKRPAMRFRRARVALRGHSRDNLVAFQRICPLVRSRQDSCSNALDCQNPAASLTMKTGYLIDMDGVIYRENHLIPGAAAFVQALAASGTPFLFLTNNSAPTPEDLAVRLKHLGVPGLSGRHFYTSALNTAEF